MRSSCGSWPYYPYRNKVGSSNLPKKKRFRKSDFQWHLCSFLTWATLKNSSSTVRLRLIKERGDPGSLQGETLSGGATTPSATPGKKGLPSLGEDRKKSLQETLQGSGSNSVERFIGLVL